MTESLDTADHRAHDLVRLLLVGRTEEHDLMLELVPDNQLRPLAAAALVIAAASLLNTLGPEEAKHYLEQVIAMHFEREGDS